jgi:hypothetical protein
MPECKWLGGRGAVASASEAKSAAHAFKHPKREAVSWAVEATLICAPMRVGDFGGDVQTVLLQRYWLTMHGGRWASSARLTAHAALSNKSAMTTAWPRIS